MTQNGLKKQKNSFNVLLKKESCPPPSNPHSLRLDHSCILIGDVLTCLQKIPDQSVNLVVTSPPYWNLRDYYNKKQIGSENSPQEYIRQISKVGDQIQRILKNDGAYFLNLGDKYLNQNLQMIPERIAISMMEKGWLLRNKIIWYKPNHMPSPVKTRLKNTYEVIFFFSKNDWEKKVSFDLDQIRIPHQTQPPNPKRKSQYMGKFQGETKNIGASPGARMSVSWEAITQYRNITATPQEITRYLEGYMKQKKLTKKELTLHLGKNYVHKVGHWFRKDAGFSFPSRDDWLKLKKILDFDAQYDQMMTRFYSKEQGIFHHRQGKNPGDVWFINTQKTNEKHFSIFPEEIPYRAIKACCPKNGVVLDPFAGTGTTGKVAQKLNRKFLLIEIQQQFLEIIRKNVGHHVQWINNT